MAEKTPFNETRLYPIVFMVAVTIVFVGVLAAFQKTTEKRVEEHSRFVKQATLLKMFALPAGKNALTLDPATVKSTYLTYITEIPVDPSAPDNEKYYLCHNEAGDTLGYAYLIYGKGLWSTIGALLALSPDRTRVLNLDILEEVETPGLGARIEEPWFKNQFSGKAVRRNNQPVEFTLVPEGDPGKPDDDRVSMITGATITTRAVTDMITGAVKNLPGGGGR
jgi:Na+-transporting NADH:ubiquinone oxidoreductase subunit C